YDIVVVQMLKRNKWVLKAKCTGFRVYDEEKSLSFIIPKYLIHWARIIPILGTKKPPLTFLSNLIDRDMFLN
ncbi:hypothetical protein B0H14DRAFT_2399020, partial [Mycena olivaceomarginata]